MRLHMPLIVALIQIFGTRAAQHNQPAARPLDAFGYALLVIGPVALAFRRSHRRRISNQPAVICVTFIAATEKPRFISSPTRARDRNRLIARFA